LLRAVIGSFRYVRFVIGQVLRKRLKSASKFVWRFNLRRTRKTHLFFSPIFGVAYSPYRKRSFLRMLAWWTAMLMGFCENAGATKHIEAF